MEIKQAEFVLSAPDLKHCPEEKVAEYAFIGRSNVGKSSLINMLVKKKGLAKTSSTPGKTQLINFFKINESWMLVDLPGYGYAKVAKSMKGKFHKIITNYVSKRENLVNLFVLIDCRHAPQRIDLDFMEWLGEEGIPFSIVFTKVDKVSSTVLQKNLSHYKKEMLKVWEEMPVNFISSSTSEIGRLELLNYIGRINESLVGKFN
ncbi:MAG: ribosome biogenesis GTP-binding protein YihA/YsxC [Schleiferiaceae bacterium]|jgi:GTP-binding protein|nr:ribosome biogenesis GTP-binding protein YihA/YsxC [Schleiferiaceae bacterium]